MQCTSNVIAALQTLKNAAENVFEEMAVDKLENTLQIFAGEVWKDIEGYNGRYQVSNFGRVKSFQRLDEKILSIEGKKRDYAKVVLFKDNVAKTFLLHRLVAIAFVPNPENKPEVNHIDGNKKNNCAENLEWVTKSENIKDAFDTGLAKVFRGVENGAAKLTPEQVREIRRTYIKGDKNFSSHALARKFNVSSNSIRRVVNFATYKDVM